ncbi:MAG: hypothetical protein K0S01_3655 [Herbinix sp.]|jgi:hypothetical protein|nr:hypothetical protein [Herbinix sp.]
MKFKTTLIGILIGVVILSQTACTKLEDVNSTNIDGDSDTYETGTDDEDSSSDDTKDANNNENETELINTKIMDEFEALVTGADVKLVDIITYLKSNIEAVTPDNASTMMLRFEELQIQNQTKLEDKYFPEIIQKSFQEADQKGIDFNEIDEQTDSSLRDLLQETKDSGYKLEQAEGFYFPVIDYSVYQQFAAYVTPDIKDYINITTVESGQVFAKDAALVIGWDEVIKRALSQETFLTNHSNSVKADVVKGLYQKYEKISMFGLNNTPLFDYETKIINEEAKLVYEDSLAIDLNSKFLLKLKGFMDIVKSNKYQLTEEVDRFRNENTTSENTTNDANTNKGNEGVEVGDNPYSVAGIDNASEFEKTFHLLQDLVAKEDKKTVAEYVAYPINVMIDGTKTNITDENKFIENYDRIINKTVKDAFLNQNVEDLFVNYMGVMVGQGELWFNQLEGTKHTYSIYGINN